MNQAYMQCRGTPQYVIEVAGVILSVMPEDLWKAILWSTHSNDKSPTVQPVQQFQSGNIKPRQYMLLPGPYIA